MWPYLTDMVRNMCDAVLANDLTISPPHPTTPACLTTARIKLAHGTQRGGR